MTIAAMMAIIAATTVLLVSTGRHNGILFALCLFAVEFVLPWRFLLRIGRPKSAAEAVAAALAWAYLTWGGLFRFHPSHPELDSARMPEISPWAWGLFAPIFHPTPWPGFYATVWGEVRRWNWILLAILYAALLIEVVASWKRRRTGQYSGSDAIPPGNRAARVDALTLSAAAGVVLGLVRSWMGWPAVAVAFLLAATVLWRRSTRGRLWAVAMALAMFWGFAVSVQFVNLGTMRVDSLGSRIILRSVKPSQTQPATGGRSSGDTGPSASLWRPAWSEFRGHRSVREPVASGSASATAARDRKGVSGTEKVSGQKRCQEPFLTLSAHLGSLNRGC